MKEPKFPNGSLVVSKSEIFEVISSTFNNDDVNYILRLKAFLRNPTPSEWDNQLKPVKKEMSENELSSFDHPKPKYELGDRVKLPHFNCHVMFIKFENYHYNYHVKNEAGLGGWIVEEGYLST